MSSVDERNANASAPLDLDERRRKALKVCLAALNRYAEITGATLFVENNRVRARLNEEILGNSSAHSIGIVPKSTWLYYVQHRQQPPVHVCHR
jgi:hypothetical protein